MPIISNQGLYPRYSNLLIFPYLDVAELGMGGPESKKRILYAPLVGVRLISARKPTGRGRRRQVIKIPKERVQRRGVVVVVHRNPVAHQIGFRQRGGCDLDLRKRRRQLSFRKPAHLKVGLGLGFS